MFHPAEPGVLLISPYPPCRTGPAEYAAVFSREIARRGYPVTVLTEDLPGSAPPPPPGVSVLRGWANDWLLPWRMFRSARRAPGEVLHVNYSFTMYGNPVVGLLTLGVFALLRRHRPMIVTVFDVLPKHSLTRETLNLYSIRAPPRLARWAVQTVLRFWSRAAERIVVQSPSIRDLLVEDYHVPPDRIAVTELPGYPPSGRPPPTVLPGATDRRDVLFYGFLAPYKGIEPLLEAFARARALRGANRVRLVIAGTSHPRLNSDYRSVLEAHARQLGLTDREVAFLGYVDGSDAERLFATSQLVVLPYLQTTGSSGTLASAIGLDRPVVVTALAPLVSQLNGYPLGRVVAPGNVDELAEVLVQVDQNRFVPAVSSPSHRRRTVTWTDLVRDTVALYAATLHRYRSTRRVAEPGSSVSPTFSP